MIAVHSPADGRVVGKVADQSPEEVAATVADLRDAQPAWADLAVRDRVRWVRRYRDWLLDNDDRLARLMQEETGKPWAEANLDLPYAVDLINYYCANAEKFLAEETPRPHGPISYAKKLRRVYRPYQVVGVIAPWNFPLALALIDSIPALLAGCSVIVKPSEFTPLSTQEVVRGWQADVGAPAVFACATGFGATGAAVVDTVDFVQFTGSTRTGRAIAGRAAERLIPCGLELGGKDAMIVLADADLERAANAAVWGAMANAGQMCTSVERVYVEAPAYEGFVERVADKVRALRLGVDDQDYRADVGPLATAAQVDIVERHIADAVAKGAGVLVGGERGESGNLFQPTVLLDVDHTMACMREETFGPTLPVMPVADAEEAVRFANDSPYGLSASVWTKDRRKGEAIARRLDAGAVNINDVFANLFTLPLAQAGWKQSGIGARLGGAAGIRKYCRTQAIVGARVEPVAEPQWYPYTRLKGRVIRRLTRVLGARDLRRRFRQ
jgi:acyl-CoA reductase-like NAD-dependent aldehyde dehydrogenase